MIDLKNKKIIGLTIVSIIIFIASIFLYKQNADEDTPTQDIVVDLQKQRNGCTGTLNLRFVKRLSEFRNLVK